MWRNNCGHDHTPCDMASLRHCNYSLLTCLIFFLLHACCKHWKYKPRCCPVYSYAYASDGLKARNSQCPREYGILQGSCTHSHKFPMPVTSGMVFLGYSYRQPKNTLGPPMQNTRPSEKCI